MASIVAENALLRNLVHYRIELLTIYLLIMGLQKIVVLCVLGLIIIVGGWFLLFSDNDDKTQVTVNKDEAAITTDETEIKAEDTNDDLSGFGSIKELFSLGKNITCEYTYSDESSKGSGVGFFAGDRMRMDSEITTNGMTFESHMINDGENLYTWSETAEGTFAIITPVSDAEIETNFDDSNFPQTNTDVDAFENDVTYTCKPWGGDRSRFTPPTDIEFVDMTKMMGGLMEGFQGSGMNEGDIKHMMENLPIPQ